MVLPLPDGPGDGQELALGDVERHAAQRRHDDLAQAVVLGGVLNGDDGVHDASFGNDESSSMTFTSTLLN